MTSSSFDMKEKPLENTCCFIETYNDDGSDVSSSHAKYLQDLGAEITDHIGEKVTHYICSNVSPTKMAAARLLKIHILSPLWIEQCRQLGAKAHEADFEYNIDLVKIISEFVHGRFNDPSLTNSSSKVSKPHSSIPLPSFKEFILPRDNTVLKRRRSERISDLHDSDEEDDDDSESDRENERKFEHKADASSRDRSSTDQKLKRVDLKEAMELTRDKSLPVVYFDEPYEETWKRFEANLAADLVLDGNGPGQHKHPFTVLSRGKRRSHLSSSSHSVTPSSSKKERRRSARNDDSSVSSNLSDSEEDNVDDGSNSGSFSYFKSTPAKQPKTVASAKKPTASKQTDRSSVLTRAEVIIPKGKIIIALTGFRKRNGEYESAEKAIMSLVDVIKSKKHPITTPNKQLPSSSSKITSKNLPSLIHPFETDVDIFPDTSNYEARITFVIVSKKNQSRTLRILFALAQGIPILDEEWIHACIKKEQWLNPLDYIYHRYRSLYHHLLTPSSFVQSSSSWTLLPRGMFKNRIFCVLRSTMPDTGILCQLIKKAGGTVTRNILTKEKLSYLVCGDLDDMKEWMITKKNHFAKSPEYAMLDTYVHLKHPQIVTSKFIFNILEEQCLRYALKKAGESITFLDYDPMVEHIPALIRRRKEGGYRGTRNIRYQNLDSDTDDVGHDYDGSQRKKVVIEGQREELEIEEEFEDHENNNSSRKRKGEKDEQTNQRSAKKVKIIDDVSNLLNEDAEVEMQVSPDKRVVNEDEEKEKYDDFVINLEPPHENFIQEMLHRYCKKDNPEELLPLQHFTDPYVDYMDAIKRKEEKERQKNLAASSSLRSPKETHSSPSKKPEITVITNDDRGSSTNQPLTDKALLSPSNLNHSSDGNGMQSPNFFTRAVSVVRSLWNAGATMSPTYSERQQLQNETDSGGMNYNQAHPSNGFDPSSVISEENHNSSNSFTILTSPKTASSRRPSVTQEDILNSVPVPFLEPASGTMTKNLPASFPAIVSPAHRTVISFPEKESYSSLMHIEKVEHFKDYKSIEEEVSAPSAKQAADSLVLLSTSLPSSVPTPVQQSPVKDTPPVPESSPSLIASPKLANVAQNMSPPQTTHKETVKKVQTTTGSEVLSSKSEEYETLIKSPVKVVLAEEGKERRGRTPSQQSDDLTTPTPLRAKRNIKQNSYLSSEYDLSSF